MWGLQVQYLIIFSAEPLQFAKTFELTAWQSTRFNLNLLVLCCLVVVTKPDCRKRKTKDFGMKTKTDKLRNKKTVLGTVIHYSSSVGSLLDFFPPVSWRHDIHILFISCRELFLTFTLLFFSTFSFAFVIREHTLSNILPRKGKDSAEREIKSDQSVFERPSESPDN